jgi:hypothetical protein
MRSAVLIRAASWRGIVKPFNVEACLLGALALTPLQMRLPAFGNKLVAHHVDSGVTGVFQVAQDTHRILREPFGTGQTQIDAYHDSPQLPLPRIIQSYPSRAVSLSDQAPLAEPCEYRPGASAVIMQDHTHTGRACGC